MQPGGLRSGGTNLARAGGTLHLPVGQMSGGRGSPGVPFTFHGLVFSGRGHGTTPLPFDLYGLAG